jgi:hypothetical protein
MLRFQLDCALPNHRFLTAADAGLGEALLSLSVLLSLKE